MSNNRTLRHATQAGETSVGREKVFVTISHVASGHLTTQIAISLDYYVWGTVERETNKTPCNAKDGLTARMTGAFTNLKKETVRKACRRFQSHLKTMIEANGDFFE